MTETLSGWLDVNDIYDGQDNFMGTEAELYSDGPYLGTWADITAWLRRFDGKHVAITIQEVGA